MTEERAVRNYLAPLADSYWQWRDGGEVMTWADNTTIAFRGELAEVARRLAPQGLPPLGAIVLLLAACRDSWRESSLELGTLAGAMVSAGMREMPPWLGDAFAQFDRVGALRPELRSTPQSKAALVEMVLERCRERTSAAAAWDVVRALERGLPPELLAAPVRRLKLDELIRDIRLAFDGLQRLDAETLELRLRTGLDQLVVSAAEELDPAERARRLLVALEDDEELGGLARIARHLMAVAQLPRSVSHVEELRIDGFCDIVPRGPLERLLLSELANDDATLVARIALGEALYVQRETPPGHPPRHRAVLLDAGVRLWGVPRVFATAVGLSLVALGQREISVDTYRAAGEAVAAVDLTRREGLIRHLEALEPEGHPGLALPAFERALLGDAAAPQSEAVIVTSEQAAADSEFRNRLTDLRVSTLYLATVGRDGRFRLTVRSPRGSKVVREANLELDRLLEPRAKHTPPLRDKKDASLPAIFGVDPFPLRLSHAWNPETVWPVPDAGVLSLSHDGRLMYWDKPGCGARQLTDRLPQWKHLWWYGPVENGTLSAVVGPSAGRSLQLLTVDLRREEVHASQLELNAMGVRGFCHHAGVLFAVHGPIGIKATAITAFNMATGERLGVYNLPRDASWRQGRVFYFGNPTFRALAWDGSLHWETVFDEATARRLVPMWLWECYGQDGFVGVTFSGDFLRTAANEVEEGLKPWLDKPVVVGDVATDGSQALLALGTKPEIRALLSVSDLRVIRSLPAGIERAPSRPLSDLQNRGYIRSRTLPWRFSKISGGPGRRLALFTRRGVRHTLALDDNGKRMFLAAEKRAAPDSAVAFFTTIRSPEGTHFRLCQACWADGSMAWIDSRGLLHLRSSDASLPEVTLVLDAGEVSGWCSDGRCWGSRYYVGDAANASAKDIFAQVIDPFLERLT